MNFSILSGRNADWLQSDGRKDAWDCKNEGQRMKHIEEIWKGIDMEGTIHFLQKLLQVKSANPPGEEIEAARRVAAWMKRWGLEAEVISIQGKRANALGRLPGEGKKPPLLFSGHLDTVPPGESPWKFDPYSGKIVGDKIYGRGASDMKGGLVAMIAAAGALAKAKAPLAGDLLIGATADEEAGTLGARHLVESGAISRVSGVLIGEPSDLSVYIAEKGAFWLEIVTRGKTAHGAMPDLGINAILQMNKVLARLSRLKFEYRRHPLLGKPTLNIGTIVGGIKTNVVPDACKITIDIRTVPGQSHKTILKQVQDVLEELSKKDSTFQGEVRIVSDLPALETPPQDPLVKVALRASRAVTGQPQKPRGVMYYTDGVAFVPKLKIPMVICGPGKAGLAHQPDEYVEIPKVHAAARIYSQIAMEMLGS
jgi:succinyl-diaminopimelate desuccinylase